MFRRTVFGASLICLLVAGAVLAQSKQPTSEEILRKCADTYKSMESYYDESIVEMSFTSSADSFQNKTQMRVAFKRPSDLKISVTGNDNVTLYADGKQMIMYVPKENVYVDLETRSKVVDILKGAAAFIAAAALSDDPYSVMMEGVDTVGNLETVQLDGREVYRVRLTQKHGATDVYFDKDRHVILAITVRVSQETPQGTVEISVSTKAGKVLIDEFPRDADGGEIDVLSFALPEGTEEYDPQAAKSTYKCYSLKGKPAPDFALPDLDGKEVRLWELRGKVVLLDFWAIGCPPCRRSLPELIEMAAEYEGKPFEYVAVSIADTAEAVSHHAAQNKLEIPALIGAGSRVPDDYMIEVIPTMYIVDKKGVVREVEVGWPPGRSKVLKSLIDELLAEEPELPPEE